MINDNENEVGNENRSHRYGIKRPRHRDGHKYLNYKICQIIMIAICIKQHLSNITSSINEKIKQHWGWVKKKALLIKKVFTWKN